MGQVKGIFVALAAMAGCGGFMVLMMGGLTGSIYVTGVACLLGIFARLAQAEEHHQEMKTLGKASAPPAGSPLTFTPLPRKTSASSSTQTYSE
jgi:hypothetical protein